MTFKEFFPAVGAKIKTLLSTKTGKVIAAIVIALVIGFFSGGIGTAVGCVKQMKETHAVQIQLDAAEVQLKAYEKQIAEQKAALKKCKKR
jgi:uncharacterized membrane-anchored protein YhcB (DUF1043 family)